MIKLQLIKQQNRTMNWKLFVLTIVLALTIYSVRGQDSGQDQLTQEELKQLMFTMNITGDLIPLKPTTYGWSQYWPFPVEVYDIVMMRATHKFLPSPYNATKIFAYAGYINGQLVPSFPGPTLSFMKNMPCYVRYTNNINGSHILPVDTSPPFNMVGQFLDEVPTVPHAHGVETEQGPDGQPMGFWTQSGRKGPDYFSLKSEKKPANQAIFRYQNTKEGLNWYHDHAMAITRLNVYAGLVGLYQIIDPQISSEEQNILKMYGDIERKYFALADKTFRKNGSLFYPDKPFSPLFKHWTPGFKGTTMTVNGKVWPKVTLKPKLYRFVFLNGCQDRYLNISFENNNQTLDFQIFRRDSDYLRTPITLKKHTLLTGGRIEIFLNLTDVRGEVMMKNVELSPSGEQDEYMSKIMKIVIDAPKRNLQQNLDLPTDFPTVETENADFNLVEQNQIPNNPFEVKNTLLSKIQARMDAYSSRDTLENWKTFDFMDETQPDPKPARKSAQRSSRSARSVISGKRSSEIEESVRENKYTLQDYTNSNEKDALTDLINIVGDQSVRQPQSQVTAHVLKSVEFIKKQINTLRLAAMNLRRWKSKRQNLTITNVPYPRFKEGTPYFTILTSITNPRFSIQVNLAGLSIDGVSVKKGCQGAKFKKDKEYDFYIINTGKGSHPIHIHLVNFQVIERFSFNVSSYKKKWQDQNGKLLLEEQRPIPKQIDVRPYKIPGSEQPPADEERLFMDVIDVPGGKVTVARVKFANHYGKRFPFDITNSKYVWHCHFLEHEDNEMMRYFCIE